MAYFVRWEFWLIRVLKTYGMFPTQLHTFDSSFWHAKFPTSMTRKEIPNEPSLVSRQGMIHVKQIQKSFHHHPSKVVLYVATIAQVK